MWGWASWWRSSASNPREGIVKNVHSASHKRRKTLFVKDLPGKFKLFVALCFGVGAAEGGARGLHGFPH
jgi:hypothetical protein